jgi:hypothetical protein
MARRTESPKRIWFAAWADHPFIAPSYVLKGGKPMPVDAEEGSLRCFVARLCPDTTDPARLVLVAAIVGDDATSLAMKIGI